MDRAVVKYLLDRYVPTGRITVDTRELLECDGRFEVVKTVSGSDITFELRNGATGSMPVSSELQ